MTQVSVEYVDHMGDDLAVVNDAPIPTMYVRIKEAIERGYRMEDGAVIGLKGHALKLTNGRYPSFSTNWGGVFAIPAHKFAAFYYYGEACLEKGKVVRHLNGNTRDISKENIKLGTYSENEMDKDPAVRSRSATLARKAQPKTPANAKLSDTDVANVLQFYRTLSGKKAPSGTVAALGARYGVSRTVLCKIKNGEYYDHVSI